LLAGYNQRPVWATFAEMDPKFTITPPPRAAMHGRTASANRAALTRLTSRALRHWARVDAAPSSSYEQARFTRMSTEPKVPSAVATHAEIASSSVISVRTNAAMSE
jgi:hypothetical protein